MNELEKFCPLCGQLIPYHYPYAKIDGQNHNTYHVNCLDKCLSNQQIISYSIYQYNERIGYKPNLYHTQLIEDADNCCTIL